MIWQAARRGGRGSDPGLLSCLLLLALLGMTPARAAEAYQEESVKAAFLSRFTAFVEWPAAALQSGEFRFAVLGAPLVADQLTQLVEGKPIHERPVRVQHIESPAEARDAHVLYVGAGYAGSLARLSATIGDRPVLIVMDHPLGLDEGGVINFLIVDRRVRFEVSLNAAQRAGLRISSQLLSVAVRVRGTRSASAAP